NMGLSPEDVHSSAPVIQAADVLICQLEIPMETTLEALRVAKAARVRTILNPAPAAALPDQLLGLCDFCVPNETETETLTGRPRLDAVRRATAVAALSLTRIGTPVSFPSRQEADTFLAQQGLA